MLTGLMRGLATLPVAVAAAIGASVMAGCKERSAPSVPVDPAAARAVTARYRVALETLRQRLNFLDIASVDFSTSPPRVDARTSSASWERISATLTSAQAELAELGRIAREPHAADIKTITSDPMQALGAWRNLARTLRADAIRAARARDAATGAERVATILLAARHMAQDADMLNALTAAALIGLGTQAIDELQTGPHAVGLGADQKTSLLAALDCLDAEDPAGIDRARRAGDPGGDAKDLEAALKKTRDAVKDARRALR